MEPQDMSQDEFEGNALWLENQFLKKKIKEFHEFIELLKSDLDENPETGEDQFLNWLSSYADKFDKDFNLSTSLKKGVS